MQRRMLSSSPAGILGISWMTFSCCHQTPQRRYPHSQRDLATGGERERGRKKKRERDHTTVSYYVHSTCTCTYWAYIVHTSLYLRPQNRLCGWSIKRQSYRERKREREGEEGERQKDDTVQLVITCSLHVQVHTGHTYK